VIIEEKRRKKNRMKRKARDDCNTSTFSAREKPKQLKDGPKTEAVLQGFPLNVEDSDITVFHGFVRDPQDIFEKIKQELKWTQLQIKIFGKNISVPRLTCYVANEGANYRYSGISLEREEWESAPALSALRNLVQEHTGEYFNAALCNFYRNGRDSMDWHSDDEKSLVSRSIASVSLGATRCFQIRSLMNKKLKKSVDLMSGTLLVMAGNTQISCQHRVPKVPQRQACGERINITFRKVAEV